MDINDLDPRTRSVVMDTLPCAVIVLDADAKVVYWNESAERLTGYSAEEVTGTTCEMLRSRMMPNHHTQLLEALCPLDAPAEGTQVECDVTLKDGSTLPVLRHSRPVVDEHGQRGSAVIAMVDVSRVKQAQDQIRQLQRQIARAGQLGQLVGSSDGMQRLFEAIDMVADTDASVVIEGETGTGKELVARTIHARSDRRDGPFLPVNCGALPETLLEAELFGHVKGAFTGAVADRAGRFEEASGGTLFLDEIGELPLGAQVKLLRVLQESEITRVGESTPRKVDVRILSATHRDLRAMIAQKTFREDLYYRLRVVGLAVPALRERPEDIPDLVGHFVDQLNAEYGRAVRGCDAAAMQALWNFDWPGNVRQLRHALEHAYVVTAPEAAWIGPDALPAEVRNGPGEEPDEPTPPARPSQEIAPSSAPATPEAERAQVRRALQQTDQNKAAAARLLGITRAGLYKKMKRLGIS